MSTVPMIEYTPKKLQMIKYFRQMMDKELEDIGELEYDDDRLFKQLEEINEPPDYVLNALQNNENSTDSKTIAGLNPTGQPQYYVL